MTRSIRLADKVAADVLVPSWTSTPSMRGRWDDLLAEAQRTGCSRFPVVEEDLDHVVGVSTLNPFNRVPRCPWPNPDCGANGRGVGVPETRSLDGLMEDFRRAGSAMAVVVDEHGGTAGVVTEEDVLEELIGEIDDDLLDLLGRRRPPRTQVEVQETPSPPVDLAR
ncbi:MAG: hypothetical protein Ct9H300mP12_11640 [Acidimicrobiales bacterium]|nr:MAG: hypothetical protein Ct9H300mP12_11640 [Acidimicrobiales bacterium]